MAESSKKSKKKGLMIVIILLVVLILAAVAVVVLAKLGKINIPGLSPKKPVAAAKKPEVKPKKAPPKKKEPTAPPVVAAAPINDKEGAVKLATVWNEIPTDGLVKIIKTMTPTEIAPVLVEMDTEKSAALLAAMDAKTATIVSRELKRVASQVETPK
jgi:hypothetical protein